VDPNDNIQPALQVLWLTPAMVEWVGVPVVETDIGTDDNYVLAGLDPQNPPQPPQIVYLSSVFGNGHQFALWRDNYETDFPNSNTVYVTFGW
jgi:hypothetical protein